MDVRRGMPYSPDILAMTIRVIVTVVLTVLVVHRDPAVGTTAFWRTRPITRRHDVGEQGRLDRALGGGRARPR